MPGQWTRYREITAIEHTKCQPSSSNYAPLYAEAASRPYSRRDGAALMTIFEAAGC